MAFQPEGDELEDDADAEVTDASEQDAEQITETAEEHAADERVVQLVPVKVDADGADGDDTPRTPPPAGGRPTLTRVK